MSDTGPLFVSSGDLIADRRYNAAIALASRGDFVAAADLLTQTAELAPHFATAWFALGAIRDRLGERDGAVVAFQRARAADPATLAALATATMHTLAIRARAGASRADLKEFARKAIGVICG